MKKIFYCIFALTVATGCYKDESSDRYDPIGVIEITGVEEEYRLIAGIDALEITPAVTSTDPADNADGFDYLWTCYSNTEASSTSAVIDTIAQTKDIAWDITLKPGDYTVRLRVTNPANGYEAYLTASLAVSTEYSNGFYLLKETAGGNTELDFHKPDGAGGWRTAPDILEAQFGAPITDAPTSLALLPDYPYVNRENGQATSGAVIVPMGGKDMKILLLEDMSLVYDHNELFFSGEAPGNKPLRAYYMSLFGYSFFVFDDGAYVVTSSSQTGKVGFPVAPEDGCSLSYGMMSAGPYAGYNFGGMQLHFFDEGNNRLVYYDYAGSLMDLSGNPSPFNITHRPLFMGSSGWCVFRDPGSSDRFLYLLGLASANMAIDEIRPLDPTVAPNFSSAEVYGSNKQQSQFLYGGKGDKLYMYNTGNDTEKLLTPSGFGAGEQITMITHKQGVHNPADRTDTAGFLFIATHQGGRYKVYMYKVIGGEPDGAPIIIEGEGKVTDMQYAGGTSTYGSTISDVY